VDGFDDVTPDGDFDGDGAPELHEFWSGSDPTLALSRPQPVDPVGTFIVRLSPDEAAAGHGTWNLTGTYTTALDGTPLIIDILHDAQGNLRGSARCHLPSATVAMALRGSVRGAAGRVTLRAAGTGASPDRTTRVAIDLDLTLNPGRRCLEGTLTGQVHAGTVRTPVHQVTVLDLPAGVDGSWTLRLDLQAGTNGSTGTAWLTLAGREPLRLVARTSRGAQNRVDILLTPHPDDLAAHGIELRLTVVPMTGGWARLDASAGQAFGQRIDHDMAAPGK